MATRERLYSVDEVWRLACAPENEAKKICLIDGEMLVTMSPGYLHARIAGEIARLVGNFVVERDLGDVVVESGHYPPADRHTLLLPDVAFIKKERIAAPDSDAYAPFMPDLVVEIVSPSQTLAQARRKAGVYLRLGTELVWLIQQAEKTAEVWTAAADGKPISESVGLDGALSGGAVLPGFALPLRRLFRE